MRKKTGYTFAITFLVILLSLPSQGETYLSRIQYGTPEDGLIYQYGIDIAVSGNEVFVLENLKHRVLKYRLNGQLESVKTIGQKGKGPSDLYLPVEFSLWNGVLAIDDEEAISFFDTDGRFLGRFRFHSPGASILHVNDRVYIASPAVDSSDLVGIYDRKGKLLNSFCKKSLDLESDKHKRGNRFFSQRYFYEGKLLTDGERIYYINAIFGWLIEFTLEGKKVRESNVAEVAGELGKRVLKASNDRLSEGIKIGRDRTYYKYTLFHDAFLFKKTIYILVANLNDPDSTAYNRRSLETYIVPVEVKTLTPGKKYRIKLEEGERVHSFVVTERGGKVTFLVSMYTKEGSDIVGFSE